MTEEDLSWSLEEPLLGHSDDSDHAVSSMNNFTYPVLILFHVVVVSSLVLSARMGYAVMTSLLCFLVMFLIIGQALRIGIFRYVVGSRKSGLESQDLGLDILFSMSLTTIITILLGGSGILSSSIPLIVAIVLMLDSTYIIVEGFALRSALIQMRTSYRGFLKSSWVYAICVLIGLAIILWRQSHFVWPEASGTDLFTHLTVTRLIIQQNGSDSLLSSYPYIFHAFAAIISQASGLDPFILFSSGSTVPILLGVVFVYQFTNSFVDSNRTSLLVAGLFSFVAEGGALLGTQYLYPSTYAFLGGLAVMTVIRMSPSGKYVKGCVIAAYAAVSVAYPNFILATLPPVVILWAQQWSSRSVSGKIERFGASCVLVGVAFIALYYTVLPLAGIEWTPLVIGMEILTLEPTLAINIPIILMAYSSIQLLLFVFGIFSISRRVLKKETEGFRSFTDLKFVALITAFYITVFFLPLHNGHRIEYFARPMFILSIVTGAFYLASLLQTTVKREVGGSGRPWKPHSSKLGASVVIVLLLMSTYPTLLRMDIQMTYEPHNPHRDELLAFDWLKERVPIGGYVLTDEATGFLMRSFILRNSSTSMIESGRPVNPSTYTELRRFIFEFFNASSGEEIESYETIVSMCGEPSFIVVSPRTSGWLYRLRVNRSGFYMPYSWWLSESDASIAKFNNPEYVTQKIFGELRILVRRNTTTYFHSSFESAAEWDVTSGNPPTLDHGILTWSNQNHITQWYHLFTTNMSFVSPEYLCVRMICRANTTDLFGKGFIYTQENITGTIFLTDLVRFPSNWQNMVFQFLVPVSPQGYRLESLSIGVTNLHSNWKLEIQLIEVYGL